MKVNNQIKLVTALEEERKDWIARVESYDGSVTTLFKLGSQDFFEEREAFIKLLRNRLLAEENSLCIINMQGIDFLSPSAANVSVSGALDISRQNQIPIIFTQVTSEVLQGLKTAPSASAEDRILWAVDTQGNEHILGSVPDRLGDILKLLKEKGRASASEIAAVYGEENSKKNINRFSVYLQELFNTGLANREKIVGSARDGAGRGWTYVYRPAYADIPKTLV